MFPEDGKRADPNVTLALRSPLLNYTGTWCTLSMSVHSSWDESPIRVVVQDSDQKTVIDFGHHKAAKYVANRSVIETPTYLILLWPNTV